MPRFPTAHRAPTPSLGNQIAVITLVITSVILVVSVTACAGIGWAVFSAVSTGIDNYSQKSEAQKSASEFMQLLAKDESDKAYDSATAEFRSQISREDWTKLLAQMPSFRQFTCTSHNSVEGEAPHRTFVVTYQVFVPYQAVQVADPESEPAVTTALEKKSYSFTICLVEQSVGVWKVQRFLAPRKL